VICNGENGTPGQNGQTPVITNEPPGTNCPAGGIKIVLGDHTFHLRSVAQIDFLKHVTRVANCLL